jgi:hypothetical protein
MYLNLSNVKSLGLVLLIALMPVSSRAETTKCNPTISANCSCTMPLLERELGQEDTRFLAEIWEHTYARDAALQEEFFRRHAKEILPISFRYGLIKYFVASKCGALAFDDGNE